MRINPFYSQLKDRYPDVGIAFFDIPETGSTVIRMTSSKNNVVQDQIPTVITEENFEKVIDICNDVYAKIKTADLINGDDRKENEWVNLGKPIR